MEELKNTENTKKHIKKKHKHGAIREKLGRLALQQYFWTKLDDESCLRRQPYTAEMTAMKHP